MAAVCLLKSLNLSLHTHTFIRNFETVKVRFKHINLVDAPGEKPMYVIHIVDRKGWQKKADKNGTRGSKQGSLDSENLSRTLYRSFSARCMLIPHQRMCTISPTFPSSRVRMSIAICKSYLPSSNTSSTVVRSNQRTAYFRRSTRTASSATRATRFLTRRSRSFSRTGRRARGSSPSSVAA